MDRPAVLPPEAHGDQMFPVLLPIPVHVALIGVNVLFRKDVDDGFHLERLAELLLLLRPNNVLRVDAQDVVVGALHGHTAAQGPDARHIGIGVVLQIHRKVTGGEEGVEAVQHIAELRVLFLQDLPVLPGPEQQNEDIRRKQAD